MRKRFRDILKCSLLCSMFLATSTGFTSPTDTLASVKQEYNVLRDLESNISKNNYEQAYMILHSYEELDSTFLSSNMSKIKQILSRYKEMLIIKATAYELEQNYDMAYNILKDNERFYKNDNVYLNKVHALEEKISMQNMVEYVGEVEHLHFRSLLSFPEVALNPKNTQYQTFDNEHITPKEFKRILQSLYDNNYVLVRPSELYTVKNNEPTLNNLFLPVGKKPIILSFDNINYEKKYNNKGLVDKIIIDRNDNIATYTSKKSIQNRVDYDNEFVTILNSFAATYPDFSVRKAKGVIVFSGYEGILGYHTERLNANSKFEKKNAIKVVTKLRKMGWEFCSMGYEYGDALTQMDFTKSLYKFNDEVCDIVSDIKIYATNDYCKYPDDLKNYGYYFVFYEYDDDQNIVNKDGIYYMPRKFVSGETLRQKGYLFDGLFVASEVYDLENRATPFNE